MIGFRIFSTDFRIDFSFFMFTALIFMTNNYHDIAMFFFACAVHETGHLIIMCIAGAGVKRVLISGLGIKIIQSRENLISSGKTLAILLGGPCANFLIFISGIFRNDFSYMNLILCIFNLLPFRNLDGGSILLCTGEFFNAEYICEILLKVFAVIITIIIFVSVYIFGASVIPVSAVILYYSLSELILQRLCLHMRKQSY